MRGKRLLGERKCYLVGPTYNAGAQLGLVGGGGHPAEKWRELPPHAALGHFIRPEPALTCTIHTLVCTQIVHTRAPRAERDAQAMTAASTCLRLSRGSLRPPHRNADAAAGRMVLVRAALYSRASVQTN